LRLPAVTGSGWITAESEIHFDPTDPYRLGLPG
jgi:proline racemase